MANASGNLNCLLYARWSSETNVYTIERNSLGVGEQLATLAVGQFGQNFCLLILTNIEFSVAGRDPENFQNREIIESLWGGPLG